MFDLQGRSFVAGHRGLVGSAVTRRLKAEGASRLTLRPRAQLDLTDQAAVEAFFASERPEYVFLCVEKVGGIHANDSYPAEYIRDNLAIQTNVIHSAWKHGLKKLLFLGSSCIYPRDCPKPIGEEHPLTGPLEPTNETYAIAKIAGLKMCQAYRRQCGFDAICVMPTNLYGRGDNFHPEISHVVPALIRRTHEAKTSNLSSVLIWGSGRPLREFMHFDDLAAALIFLMHNYSEGEIINVGSGEETSISDLVRLIADTVEYRGKLMFDASRPDGTPRKLLDVGRLTALGFKARIGLPTDITDAYRWFFANCVD